MMNWYPMMGGAGGMTWIYVSSLLSSLIWLVLVGVAVWALVRWVNARTSVTTDAGRFAPPAGPSAAEILRQRYARGEIDASTFAEMRANLEASGAEAHPSDGAVRGAPATTTR